MELKTGSPWPDLLGRARRSVLHLEVGDTYAVPAESEPLRRFLAGEPRDSEPDPGWNVWAELVAGLRTGGVTVARIRVVTEPLSDYHRWLLAETGDNIAVGEDVRYVPRHSVSAVPADDVWLIDGNLVAFNLRGRDGEPAGAAVTDDPGLCAYYDAAVQRLWSTAVPYVDYTLGQR
ncbi:DUF6879 family protein [Nocardia asteroides]|uniref:DUF6879 family protein n=1 Tax=Nocardia asteroides TaxID=1824 RepID=UPI001E5F7B9C|nr:DUF6879 family protein [Nocardia asteroides]UGT63859.1 hypothetical protein LTT61_11370 [Nocardia asteroides]